MQPKIQVALFLLYAVIAGAAPLTPWMNSTNVDVAEQQHRHRHRSKRGLSYNSAELTKAFEGGVPSWGYNWSPTSAGLPAAFEFVPMIYSPGTNAASVPSNSKYVMGYNEPDMITQNGGTDIDPQTAASYYINQVTPFGDRGKIIVAPAITSYDTDVSQFTGRASGWHWLAQWHSACAGRCKARVVALHWYGLSTQSFDEQVGAFKSYIGEAKGKIRSIFGGDLPIWITEFSACDGSGSYANQDLNVAFLNAVLPFLSSVDYVHRYAYFMAGTENGNGTPGLVDGAGHLTASGIRYKRTNH